MKYIKLYESFYENIINNNLISDAKDMALEYIDMGMYLQIDVFSNRGICIHEVIFDHNRYHKLLKTVPLILPDFWQ